MDHVGKYLYGIIRCAQEPTFEEVAPIGGGQGGVYTIHHDSLAAVVSNSAETQYESTRANMLAHQRVLERVMGDFCLLPVRFGTVTPDFAGATSAIRKLLEKRYQEFHRLLLDMEGKAELGLKALWRDEKAVFQEILAESPAIRRLRDSLAGRPPEVVRLEGLPLGELVKGALERKKRLEASTLLSPLRPLAVAVKENDVILDRMVLNAAFLVDRARGGEFDCEVNRLDKELGHRVALRYIGPVPPYNFVNITVRWQEL